MNAWEVWGKVSVFLVPIGAAWLVIMRKQYELAMQDKKLTWWEIRCLFLDGLKAIPTAILNGIIGTISKGKSGVKLLKSKMRHG